MKNDKTHSFTDANGTQYIVDAKTRKIITTMDRSGFTYNSKGERTGNIHGYSYMEGFAY